MALSYQTGIFHDILDTRTREREQTYEILKKKEFQKRVNDGEHMLQALRHINGIQLDPSSVEREKELKTKADIEAYFDMIRSYGFNIHYEKRQTGKPLEYHTCIGLPFKSWEIKYSWTKAVKIVSMGFQANGGIYSSIMVDNVDYSCKGRGLNGVVIDPLGGVIDSWVVDTFFDGSLKMIRARNLS